MQLVFLKKNQLLLFQAYDIKTSRFYFGLGPRADTNPRSKIKNRELRQYFFGILICTDVGKMKSNSN